MNPLESLLGNLGNLGNLEEVAAKLGLPADKVHGLVESVQAKVAGGTDHLSAIQAVIQEHGISLDSLQGMLGNVTSALDKDGDGNPFNDLGGIAKGLFGKS